MMTEPARQEGTSAARGDGIELAALSIKGSTAYCRILPDGPMIALRASGLRHVVPGEILVVQPKRWRDTADLSAEIVSVRLDAGALGLEPLALKEEGIWDPNDQYWGEEGDPIEEWAEPIIARGPRPAFEMEHVIPGEDPDDPDSDPIIESNDLKEVGRSAAARAILMELCRADLRCLDAHAHLGNLVFDRKPEFAFRHYAVGVRIGELSLGSNFDGVLPWGRIYNRPFLRCMHGFGLCLWRLAQFDEAARVFERMLWLNPSDNTGARFLVGPERRRTAWEDRPDGL